MAKKILYTSDSSRAFSGFGKHAKIFLKYFYSRKNEDGTPKYELIEAHQGSVRKNDQILKSTPWKSVAVMPDDEEFMPFVQNGNIPSEVLQQAAYGAFELEKIIKEEKPDVFLNVQDPWAFRLINNKWLWECEWYNKIHTILWSPLDSLPGFLPLIEGMDKISHFFTKAPFAKDDLHEKGYTHVECMPILTDVDQYRAFSDTEKLLMREKYNIPFEDVTFGFVFRNQTRKKVICLLEGFKTFQDNNPRVKTKLLLLTSYEEGWNIPAAIKELGIDNSSVLVVHICRNCSKVTIKPFEGQATDCHTCQTGKSVFTPNTTKGVSESELVEFFSLLNGYLQISNSGGGEIPLMEAFFAGIPTASIDYSYGSLYSASGKMYLLDYSFDREIGANFKKAVIDPKSIAAFMQKVKDFPEEMKQIGLEGREWALQNLHPNITLKKVEEYIDNLPPVDYDFNFCTSYPNPEAIFPENIDDEDEFIFEMLYRFFGARFNHESDDYKKVKQALNGGGFDRKSAFSHTVGHILAEKRRKNFDPRDYIKETGRPRLLFEYPAPLAETLESLTIIHALHDKYSDYDFYISCGENLRQVYEHLEFVTGFIPFMGAKPSEYWEGNYVDLFFSPGNSKGWRHGGKDKPSFVLDSK